jgi:hypothetical protein
VQTDYNIFSEAENQADSKVKKSIQNRKFLKTKFIKES